MTRYVTYFHNFRRFSYLLVILIKRDVKKKHKGSFLGILWSLLNPLLNMLVLTIVFSSVFHSTIKNFPVYLLTGNLLFGFFASSTTASMQSIISSSHLITKVYIPKYILTISRLMSDFIFFTISLIDLIIIMLVTKAPVTISVIYAPIYLVLLFLFSCGISLMLATLTVFFRDIEHLYGVVITILMYASAIFYPATIIPSTFRFILTFNPLYYLIEGFREAVYSGAPLNMETLLVCIALASLSMVVGILVFERYQDKFILHI